MKNNILDILGCSTCAVFTAVQTNEVFQMISLIITIITGAITAAFQIYLWYKKAKADGKITIEEVEEGLKIVEEIKEKSND